MVEEFHRVRRGDVRGGRAHESGGVQEPLWKAPGLHREPPGKDAGAVGERPGFSHSEHEPHRQQHAPPGDCGGKGREGGPPHDQDDQHHARAIAIPDPPGNGHEQALPQGEGRLGVAELRLRQAQVVFDPRGRLADARAVEVQNEREYAEVC